MKALLLVMVGALIAPFTHAEIYVDIGKYAIEGVHFDDIEDVGGRTVVVFKPSTKAETFARYCAIDTIVFTPKGVMCVKLTDNLIREPIEPITREE